MNKSERDEGSMNVYEVWIKQDVVNIRTRIE